MNSFYDSEDKENDKFLFKNKFIDLNAYDISLNSNTYTFIHCNIRNIQIYVQKNPLKLNYMITDMLY